MSDLDSCPECGARTEPAETLPLYDDGALYRYVCPFCDTTWETARWGCP